MGLAVVVLAVVSMLAIVGAAWLVMRRLAERAKALRRERDRLESVLAGHREMAAAHATEDERGRR
jgi:uncharacterized membrane protein YcjF (UPF0283 family)